MTQPLDAHETQSARILADQVKAGQDAEVGNGLAAEYLAMGKDTNKFNAFLKQVQTDNAQDLKGNNQLPGFVFGSDFFGNLRVNITTPAKIWGNTLRDKEEVFADIKSNSMFSGNVGETKNSQNETAIADSNSQAHAWGSVHLIALNGSQVSAGVDAQVTAENGSTVYMDTCINPLKDYSRAGTAHTTAEAGSHVIAARDGHVTAESASFVEAEDNSQVTANAGAEVSVFDNANVTAKSGSFVTAMQTGQVDAEAGSLVLVKGQVKVVARANSNVVDLGDSGIQTLPGAKVLTSEQGYAIYQKMTGTAEHQ